MVEGIFEVGIKRKPAFC